MAKAKAADKKVKARTQVCVLLDSTGSMQSRKAETIDGFNNYLADLKKDKGDVVLFTLTLFNSMKVEERHIAAQVQECPALTAATYEPDHGTPLYDAIGKTINSMKSKVLKDDVTVFVIFTDGGENASREYSQESVKALIKEQEANGWEFLFLGVGLDKYVTGGMATGLGLGGRSAYAVSGAGAAQAGTYNTISAGLSLKRSANVKFGSIAASGLSTLSEEDRKSLEGE